MRQHFITRVLYLKFKIVGGRYFQNNNREKNCITYIVAFEGFSLPTLHSAVSIAMIFFLFCYPLIVFVQIIFDSIWSELLGQHLRIWLFVFLGSVPRISL